MFGSDRCQVAGGNLRGKVGEGSSYWQLRMIVIGCGDARDVSGEDLKVGAYSILLDMVHDA